MLRRMLIPVALAAAFVCAPFVARTPSAWADTPAVTDAGTTEAATPAAPATEQPTTAPAPSSDKQPECVYKGQAMPCDKLADVFNEHPTDGASEVVKLWKGGGAVPAVILGLFAALAVASRRIDWLNQGKRKAYTAASLGGLAVLAEPASRGTTPTLGMILGAAFAAILLFTNAGKQTTGDQVTS